MTLVTYPMSGRSCAQALWNLEGFLTEWRHAGGSRHLGQVSGPASGNWQQICGGEAAQKGKLSPELALGGAGTLNLEPVLSCFERHAVSVWCHHFMARVNKNLDSIFEDYVNMLHPSWRWMEMYQASIVISCDTWMRILLERWLKLICYHPNEVIFVSLLA